AGLIDHGEDAMRNVISGMWSRSRNGAATQPLQLERMLEEMSNGRVDALDRELRLGNVNRRSGSLERRGVRHLVVRGGSRKRYKHRWNPPREQLGGRHRTRTRQR